MVMEAYKKFNGLRESIGESISYTYIITGVPYSPEGDDQAFRTELMTLLSRMENNIRLSSVTIDKQINNTTWEITATYATDKKSFPNQSALTFDTTGQTVHKTQSIKRLDAVSGAYDATGEIGKSGAIGFNGEDLEGVDIIVPSFSWTETHPIPDSVLTNEFRQKLFRATGCQNDAPFRGFKKGEVLFKGVSGSKNGTEKWTLTFNFEAIKNETNIEIGAITIAEKAGWDYLSIRYSKQVSDDGNSLIITPHTVAVDQVYYECDFAELGIGTGTWEEVTQNSIEDKEFILWPTGE